MSLKRLLIANRGEIAIRIARAAAELGIETVAIYSEDDARSLHVRKADSARALTGRGAAAYLDAAQIVAVAREANCDAVHPGYGFLAENASFAQLAVDAGLSFVGPTPALLTLFGDKLRARAAALRAGVPVLKGSQSAITVEQASAFWLSLGSGSSMVLKAVAGGGGRGMRIVANLADLPDLYARASSEARAAFGDGALYAEELMPRARHIEVQIAGDGTRAVHLYERECTVQRRHQKVVEFAPSPSLAAKSRERILNAAVRLAEAARYLSLGTFEFLLDADDDGDDAAFAFIEANPRLQVEHTVTEEVTGVDLVKTQLELAAGRTLDELGFEPGGLAPPRGFAIQLRVNMETMGEDGIPRPSGGTLTAFEPPSGPGVRTDTYGYAGYTTNPAFDSLLAKLIVRSATPRFNDVLTRAYRALCEFRIEGVATNLPLLKNLLAHPAMETNTLHTRFVDDHISELRSPKPHHRKLYFDANAPPPALGPGTSVADGRAGARIDNRDPLAVLVHGKQEQESAPAMPVEAPLPDGVTEVRAPMQGTIVGVDVEIGDQVRAGQQVIVMEAMKMEHVIPAPVAGIVRAVLVAKGDTLFEGHALLHVEAAEVDDAGDVQETTLDLDHIRPDLAEVHARHAFGLDEKRPDAVERRRKTGSRTARANVNELVDPGTFVEYGPIVIAAQRRRRPVQELIEKTPADGMIAGVGRVNGALFGGDTHRTQCVVMSYDYTVLAGTQGQQNHRKKDRLFELAKQWKLPVVFFTEGGGGRPGDTDNSGAAGLDTMAFAYFGALSGLVPLVGINSGRCFAGNAALLGCCDVVIATKSSNIGMGGPAMIEGGGLGIFRPEEVGPMSVQVPNGVVDIAVEDEAEGVRVAKRYLSYFQGATREWSCADQRELRHCIPDNRLRVYDVRKVIATLADDNSVLELRRHFGLGMVTALARIEGRPIGIIANNPTHLAGAIDSAGADKAARFMQLCDAFDLPILFLCDTPGIMVGPEVEKTALVRHAARMFVTGASLTVPFFTIVLRKGYGLGAQAMAGGSFKANTFTVSWPTGEFGGMGLEGAVKLGYRNELAAIEDPEKRKQTFDEMVARMYQHGKAVNTASHFEVDDVIDPVDSRHWIMSALRSAPPPLPRDGKKRPCIDTW
jgi:acetyl/propionyl-CoA carboxylase alpha subunit